MWVDVGSDEKIVLSDYVVCHIMSGQPLLARCSLQTLEINWSAMLWRSALILLVLASALAADTPYWQEVSFRSVYPGASLGPLPSFPPSWERLPFRAAPQPQAMASLSPIRACVLSLTADTLGMATGDVYGAAFVKGDLMSSTSLWPFRFVSRVLC
jgi:cobalamin synthase